MPRHANVVPAALEEGVRAAVLQLNAAVIAGLGVERGMTHVELFLTERGPVFGEIAARPPGGRLMPLLRRAWGFDPWRALLQVELGEPARFPAQPRRVAGTWILHPGAGTVSSVEGREEAARVPGVTRVRVRVDRGARIPPRLGTGQDIGYLQAEGPTRDGVARALERAHAALQIRLEEAG